MSHPTKSPISEIRKYTDCKIESVGDARNRYLKEVCRFDDTDWYKCHNSDTHYGIISRDSEGECDEVIVDKICPNDPRHYQVLGRSAQSNGLLDLI